jgi:UDP-N-acetylmuramoyl-L-alanyl-D-glutamate--2,6-diaminopimelate ligase
MTLREVTVDISRAMIAGSADTEIKALAYDSRRVKPGTAFVCIRGTHQDGHSYVDKAIAAGAAAIIAEVAPPLNHEIPWVHVPDTRIALATLAATLVGNPAQSLSVSGVTGTNGKSTIAFLLHYLMNKAQVRSGLLGTMFYDLGGNQVPATHTTPESLEIQQLLATMVTNGCRGLAMEVSSHALHQKRSHGIKFKTGIFTNLTQDHLDYHGTMEDYFAAKCLLFAHIAEQGSGQMIINGDDAYGRKLIQKVASTGRVTRYGMGVNNDLRALNIRYDATGTQFELEAKGRQFLVKTPLIGAFNVYNTLALLGAAEGMGLNFREAITHMRTAPQVPGRLERIQEDGKYSVFVDYAHTPDALVNVLQALRASKPRRIITVFGCGGDRDRTKRPFMAKAAENGSDICILTSDNPRSEDPEAIMADAKKGFSSRGALEIVDRREAIRAAIENAAEGDIILIAGKGHEDYQEINGVKHPFDDKRIAVGFMRTRQDIKAQERLEKQRERELHEEQARQWEQRDERRPWE